MKNSTLITALLMCSLMSCNSAKQAEIQEVNEVVATPKKTNYKRTNSDLENIVGGANRFLKNKNISKTAKGAAIGATAGAITGALVSKKKPLRGAIIGGAVGAGAGALAGRLSDKSPRKRLFKKPLFKRGLFGRREE